MKVITNCNNLFWLMNYKSELTLKLKYLLTKKVDNLEATAHGTHFNIRY